MNRRSSCQNSCLTFVVLVASLLYAPSGFARTLSDAEISQNIANLKQEIQEKGYHYTVGRTSVSDISVDELCKFDVEKQKKSAPPIEPSNSLKKSLATLPSVLDWSAQGKCTAIKNQGQCGSCWAFASTGAYESALEIFLSQQNPDLSEQYLVSCDTGCSGCNGGYCAFDFMKPGIALESCAPYGTPVTATKCPKYFPISASYSVGNDINSIKQAISSHGPVFTTLAVNSAFENYTGGVFDNNTLQSSINHCVVLVGWNDSLGAWRLRNSWGTNWGEKGYMWITYNCLLVGSYTEYAIPAGLPAPTNLAAKMVSVTQINLSWSDNSTTESGFAIERMSGTGSYAQIATVGANVTSYANTSLTSSTIYTYRVRAFTTSPQAYSDYSNESSAMTTTLATPTTLAATAASATQINLSWKAVTTGATGFYVEQAAGTGAFTKIASVAASATTYQSTKLTANTTYSYRVRAYNATLFSDYSNVASAATVLGAPTNLTATPVSLTQVKLSWTDNSSFESGFSVECETGTGAFVQVGLTSANATTFSSSGLTANTSYSYRVRAVASATYSAYSNVSTAATQLGAPTNLAVTAASSTQLNLSWTDNSTFETGFCIERKTSTGVYNLVATVGANVTSYSNTSLTSNTSYSYRVRACYSTQAYSGYSNIAAASTIFLAAPTNLTIAKVSSGIYKLTWKAASGSAAGYYLEYKSGNGVYAQIAAIPASSPYVEVCLPSSGTFTYRMRAYSGSLCSAYSNEASVTIATSSMGSTLVLDRYTPRAVEIIDAQGRIMERREVIGPVVANELASTLHIAPGVYIMRIREGSAVSQQRFMVGRH